MSDAMLPGVRAALVDPGGTTSRPFYAFFQSQATNLAALSERVSVIESTPSSASNLSPDANVVGAYSIAVQGTLRTGIVRVLLEGDVEFAGATNYYGSDSTGAKGWYAISDALADSANIIKSVDADGVTSFDLSDVTVGSGGTLQKYGFDAKGRLSEQGAATTDDLTEGSHLYYTDARADARITLQKGQPLGLATLDAGGKLDAGQLPALAITETFVVNTQVAMLALAAEEGDVAVRTDLSKSFILTASPASTLANWQELLTPVSGVTSFNGRAGPVMPASGDYTFSQIASTPTTLVGYGITDAQPSDATLTALAAANWASNALPIGSGADTVAQVSFAANTFPARASTGNLVAKTITDFGLSLVDDASATAAIATLGVGITSTGTYAARPAASTMPLGIYYATDVQEAYRSDGSAWAILPVGGMELGYAEITSQFSTTSTTAVDVTGLTVTCVVGERPAIVKYGGNLRNTTSGQAARVQLFANAFNQSNLTVQGSVGFIFLERETRISGLTPGTSYTFKLQALAISSGTTQLYSDANDRAFIRVGN